ncbi:MAG TPA: tetratricopeptide repeat protein [Chthonomonadaceae bacterium]|nr:tetratricopeptide repeat protein [Chthonomonadaceae bacterium]
MKTRTSALALVSVGLLGGALLVRFHHDSDPLKRAMAHFEAADELQETGHSREAIEEMKQAVAIYPQFSGARLGLADLYEESNHPADALATLEEGLRVGDPRDKSFYDTHLADLYREQKDYARALQYMRQALAEPSDRMTNRKELQREYAELLENVRIWDEAEQAWKDYLKSYPNDSSGLRGLRRIQHERAEAAHASKSAAKN